MPNPLTGVADADYTNRRPVAVTLRTLTGSTPQWGLSTADVLVEGVTEGTTASLMALYANADGISKVGPVGPGRDLLLQLALPLNALPVHIDKNIYASNLLNALTYQDLDGYHIGKAAFAFDQDRQNAGYREENCWYTTGELIKNGLNQYGTSLEGANTPLFLFGERPAVEESARNATALTITFSPSDSEQPDLCRRHRLVRQDQRRRFPHHRCRQRPAGGLHQRIRALCVQRHQGRRLHPGL